MDLLPALILRVLHFLYALTSLARSFWKRQTRPYPRTLQSPRQKLPKNLAVVFVGDTNISPDIVQRTIFESLLNLVEWCRIVGIPKLIIYEEHGHILRLERQICETIFGQEFEQHSSDSEMDYQPLTPPASVYSESRQLSPCQSATDVTSIQCQGQKNSEPSVLTPSLCLLSSRSSKDAIANLARSLYLEHGSDSTNVRRRKLKSTNFSLTVDYVDSRLQDETGFLPPDFMIVHPINPLQYNRTPLELHGFPPWHMRLTEIYLNQDDRRAWRHWLRSRLTYTPGPTVLDEISFRTALDEFALAEMRFGK
ncbi:hypothetical protein AGABI1DRAFT_51492 [Agaricus bisporus var. burnettii JB137-S8]|uniref:ditrans,polycis-polyprenyl diphosphate synthase [(2E,6E)-farnesyldiphosphate specific] n=2 Tax=Agaricus bisporus var. burnettii TaxID=192524 RepID=K5XKK8_AGABU|nr:uncharacterized protein AGABI1DRAFT_51492 [Agaricus bisporus var. burnettii JB137-S8]EKM83917.1 hypothetical protein AGABI1DRAFT_51492 [Agaricus bisporus var. burnettii JB137-S8]KAF7784279.1 hypothetical protein Agabi119p4_444 [Agaricus bisporus var. burnettii]